MRLNLLDILKKQIVEQGGKFKSMVDLQGNTAGDEYASASIGDDMSVTDVLSKGESGTYADFSDVDVESYGWPVGTYPSCVGLIPPVICPGGSFGTWDGTLPLVLKIAKLSDLTIGSQKRSTKSSASGNISNHWCGLPYQYAADLPVSGDKGDEQFLKIKNALLDLGWLSDTDPQYKFWENNVGNYPSFTHNGFKCQVLWKSDADHYDHIHVGCRNLSPKNPTQSEDCLYKDVDLGVKSKIVNPKKEEESGVGSKTVVFGGIGYATPTWMKSQWESAGLPTNNVIFIPYDSSDLSKIKKNNKITKIVGFSAGGSDVWDEIISNSGQYTFMGLIDPSTSETQFEQYKNGKLPTNVKSLSNYNNWDDYPKIQKRLESLEKNKVLTHTNLSHEKIPLEFFKKYKDSLD
jgi:hypothetical protein